MAIRRQIHTTMAEGPDPERATRRGLPVDSWNDLLAGMQVLISFQTRAEVLAGLRTGNWGDARLRAALAKLNASPTIPADRDVVCKRAGHALHAKTHTADRWVAASAVAKGLPLLSGDGIYRGRDLSVRL